MNYHNITKDDMLNGDGLRVVLWVSGCSLKCKNCQNPETHPRYSGILFDKKAEEEIFNELSKDYCSGITFSGGHPLESYNQEEILLLMKKIKNKYPNKTIWLYTGYIFEDISDLPHMKYIDVLVDGPFIEKFKKSNLHWVGSSNQRVIDVQSSIKENKIVLHNS